MSHKGETMKKIVLSFGMCVALAGTAMAADQNYVFKAGHPSLKEWQLADKAPAPDNNRITADRVALGQKLFFDPRLSGDSNMSCATCHNPALGWSDGLPTARGVKSMVLGRASPTIINTGFNTIHMWDGRKKTLEDQATGPLEANVEMNADMPRTFAWLNSNAGYKALFAKAYPGEPIDATTFAKAMATFERTIISNNSPFDRWVRGEAKAMTAQQVNGFKLFTGKANCAVCHSAPNFTDNGFHNLGLASDGKDQPDMGRYAQKPLSMMKGAFKTPTVREVARTAPYFHDGSAKTLMDVVEHYNRGGEVKTRLSPNIRPLNLTDSEKQDLVAFMQALSSPFIKVQVPELPQD